MSVSSLAMRSSAASMNWALIGLCNYGPVLEPMWALIPMFLLARLPFRTAMRMEAISDRDFGFECTTVVKMKQDCKDVPYVVHKDQLVVWQFKLPYDTMESFMPLAQEQLAAGRLPDNESEAFLKVFAIFATTNDEIN